MGCPTIPLSCLNPSNIFAGVYNPHCGGFADPSNFQAERAIFNSGFLEQINNYGIEIAYYINGFNIQKMDMLYGEHPTAEYSGPYTIKAYIELQEGVSLSQFGMNSEDELTAYISIDDFRTKFTASSAASAFYSANHQRIEPKSDDLIDISSLGCDRPGNRGNKIFRITEALDQKVDAGINPMLGHYVWMLKAVRYETSHETNAPQELGNDQVYDNTFSGKLSSTMYPSLTTTAKVYTQNVDTISKNDVYDMDATDNAVYGDYY